LYDNIFDYRIHKIEAYLSHGSPHVQEIEARLKLFSTKFKIIETALLLMLSIDVIGS